MGDPNYEARRKQEAERRDRDEREAQKRIAREAAAEALFDVMLPALKEFFEGRAELVIEPVNNVTVVRFTRATG